MQCFKTVVFWILLAQTTTNLIREKGTVTKDCLEAWSLLKQQLKSTNFLHSCDADKTPKVVFVVMVGRNRSVKKKKMWELNCKSAPRFQEIQWMTNQLLRVLPLRKLNSSRKKISHQWRISSRSLLTELLLKSSFVTVWRKKTIPSLIGASKWSKAFLQTSRTTTPSFFYKTVKKWLSNNRNARR